MLHNPLFGGHILYDHPTGHKNSGGCNPPNLVDNTGAAMQYWHVGFMLIQKPGKPIGALSSLRPIVILTTLRKVLSLVVLAQISSKVNSYLSAGQSGFRHGRSTADIMLVTAGWQLSLKNIRRPWRYWE